MEPLTMNISKFFIGVKNKRPGLAIARRIVSQARLKELPALTEGARYRTKCLSGSRDPFKRDTTYPHLGSWAI